MVYSEPLIHEKQQCNVVMHIYVVVHTSDWMWRSAIHLRHTCSCPVWWLGLHAGQKTPLWWGWCNFLLWGIRFVSLLSPLGQISCRNRMQVMVKFWITEMFSESRGSVRQREKILNWDVSACSWSLIWPYLVLLQLLSGYKEIILFRWNRTKV